MKTLPGNTPEANTCVCVFQCVCVCVCVCTHTRVAESVSLFRWVLFEDYNIMATSLVIFDLLMYINICYC